MPAAAEIIVRGREEVEAAFMEMRREVVREMRPALRKVGESVSREANARASSEITNIGARWSQFRIGTTVKGVYVAPKARRRSGSPRPNLGGLLLTSMQEALDAKREEVELAFEALIAHSANKAGF